MTGPPRALISFMLRDGLLAQVVVGHEEDARRLGADEGDGAVLDLAGGVALRVDIRNFLELKRAFEGYRVQEAAAQEEEVAGRGSTSWRWPGWRRAAASAS